MSSRPTSRLVARRYPNSWAYPLDDHVESHPAQGDAVVVDRHAYFSIYSQAALPQLMLEGGGINRLRESEAQVVVYEEEAVDDRLSGFLMD